MCRFVSINAFIYYLLILFFCSADHVDAAEGSGVKASTALRSCRYCDILLAEIHLSHAVMVQSKLAALRDPFDFEAIVEKAERFKRAGHGFQTAAEELLKDHGYSGLIVIYIFCD